MAEVVRKGHQRRARSFRTKGEARAWATALEAEIDAGKHGVIIPHSVADAFDRYAREVSPTKRGAHWEEIRLNKLAGKSKDGKGACGFRGMQLADLRTSDIARWRDAALKSGLAPSSVRREMNLVRSVLERCRREWGWLRSNPMVGIHKPAEGKARERRVSDDELTALMAACGWAEGTLAEKSSQRVAVAVRWALETGMRAGEIVGLMPADVDAAGRFAALQTTKNGDGRRVPLSKAALRLIDFLPPQKTEDGVEPLPLFGLSSATLDVLFRRARGKAGLSDVHFHDLRHEAITRLARRLDVLDLARMIGHRDLRSLQVYYNATPAEIAARLD